MLGLDLGSCMDDCRLATSSTEGAARLVPKSTLEAKNSARGFIVVRIAVCKLNHLEKDETFSRRHVFQTVWKPSIGTG